MRRHSSGLPVQKIGHYGLGVFAEQAKEPLFDPLLHSSDPVRRNTAQAARGVNAETMVSGGYP